MSDAETIQLITGEDEAGLPLDRLLLRHGPDMTRNKIRAMLAHGRLRLNGSRPGGPAVRLAAGDRVEILPANLEGPSLIFEDAAFIVYHKPAGVDAADALRTVVFTHSRYHRRMSSRIVLPLDRRISGVCVAAAQPRVLRHLTAAFSGGGAQVQYQALVEPAPDAHCRTLPGGWSFHIEKRFQAAALLHLTGPASLQARPLPALRGGRLRPLAVAGTAGASLAVHLHRASFPHPRTRRMMTFRSTLPRSCRELVEQMVPVATLSADLPAEPPHSRVAANADQEGPEPALRSPGVPRRGRRHTGPR